MIGTSLGFHKYQYVTTRFFFFLTTRPPPRSTLFPYTPLCRSLPPAGQRPAAPARAAHTTFGGQQPRHVGDQFAGDVEHGTIGNHVESSGSRSCGENSSTGN